MSDIEDEQQTSDSLWRIAQDLEDWAEENRFDNPDTFSRALDFADRIRKTATGKDGEAVACLWIDGKTLRELTGMKPSGLDGSAPLREGTASAHEVFRDLVDLIKYEIVMDLAAAIDQEWSENDTD